MGVSGHGDGGIMVNLDMMTERTKTLPVKLVRFLHWNTNQRPCVVATGPPLSLFQSDIATCSNICDHAQRINSAVVWRRENQAFWSSYRFRCKKASQDTSGRLVRSEACLVTEEVVVAGKIVNFVILYNLPGGDSSLLQKFLNELRIGKIAKFVICRLNKVIVRNVISCRQQA